MTWIEAALLGLLQGLTEFLPVSSSGHLALARMLFGGRAESGPLFEVVVHIGTLFAILFVFRDDVGRILRALPRAFRPDRSGEPDPDRRLVWLIGLSAIPAGVTGILLRDSFDDLVSDPRLVGGCLIATGAFLLIGRRFAREPGGAITLKIALAMGFAQALAILPGISRSGSTIAAGLITGGARDAVGRFAFLMAVIPITGAGLLEAKDAFSGEEVTLPLAAILIGLVVSFLSGWLALKVLLAFVARGRLHLFAGYCFLLGLAAITLLDPA